MIRARSTSERSDATRVVKDLQRPSEINPVCFKTGSLRSGFHLRQIGGYGSHGKLP